MPNRQERRRRQAASRKYGGQENHVSATLSAAMAAEQNRQYAEAEQLYKAAATAAPTNIQAINLLGAFYYRLGRLQESVVWFQKSIQRQSHEPDNFFNLGKVLTDLEDFDGAEANYQAALKLDPTHLLTLNNYGNLLLNRGKTEEALLCFQKAIAQNPDHSFAYHNLANAYLKQNKYEAALKITHQGLAKAPEAAALWFVRGNAFRQSQQWAEAISAYQKAQQGGAFIPGLAFNLGIAYLMEKQPESALTCFETALQHDSRRMDIHAYKAISLIESGQLSEARIILDYDRLIKQGSVFDAAGFPNWESYAQALKADILAHPSLEWERATTATRGGGHTGSLLGENLTPALKATEGMIRREVDWYISELSKDVYPDFRKLIPHQYHINLWAVVIEKTGYQIPHLHSSGWLSGVFYLQIPSSIRFDDNTQAGWIEFGKPGYDLPYQGDYPLLKIFPEAGKLILFPSYVFHRTIPTIGQDRRISVAFDIVPDDAVGRRR